jgi:hypothetical protein
VGDDGDLAEVLFVVGVGVVLAVAVARWFLQQRRREDLATLAARHGLEYSRFDPFGCTRVAFPLFRKGDGRVAEHVVWRDRRDGLPIRAFDFSYYTERRDDAGDVHRSHKHFSCVMAQVDGAWPEVSITREGILEKALDLVGFGDIQLESDEFNRLFALRSPDRRFAVTLVDARMIDFLLSTHGQLAFFLKGRWTLIVSDPLSPELVPALLAIGEAFVEHIPRVVYELWPSPFRDEHGCPLPAGDDAYGLAVAAAEEAERDPWTVLRSGPFRALEHEDGPEYDLDGNVVEAQPEDPWGRSPKPLPE